MENCMVEYSWNTSGKLHGGIFIHGKWHFTVINSVRKWLQLQLIKQMWFIFLDWLQITDYLLILVSRQWPHKCFGNARSNPYISTSNYINSSALFHKFVQNDLNPMPHFQDIMLIHYIDDNIFLDQVSRIYQPLGTWW